MIRLFVALELPEAHRLQLRHLQNGLPHVRWVAPENLHLTLRFLGDVAEPVAAELDEELAQLEADAFEMCLHGVGHFDSRRSARALWAGVEPSPRLLALQARVEAAAVCAGMAPEPRKFHPHVTLARSKGFPLDRLAPYLADFAGFTTPPIAISQFALMSSHLGKQGPAYTAEARYDLRQVIPDPEFIAQLV